MPDAVLPRRRLLAGLAAATLLGLAPPPALARGLSGTLLRRLLRQRKPVPPKPTKPPCRPGLPGCKPADVIVHRTQHPEAAAHVEHAQKLEQPTVLTLDRQHAAARRHESLRGVNANGNPTARHLDRDEYPPAMTREGGANANVRFIDPHDNRGAGRSFANQVRDLPDGARIRVLVGD